MFQNIEPRIVLKQSFCCFWCKVLRNHNNCDIGSEIPKAGRKSFLLNFRSTLYPSQMLQVISIMVKLTQWHRYIRSSFSCQLILLSIHRKLKSVPDKREERISSFPPLWAQTICSLFSWNSMLIMPVESNTI